MGGDIIESITEFVEITTQKLPKIEE